MVVDIRHDKVKLGITAPPDTTIHRKEVQEKIDRAKDTKGSEA